MANLDRLAAADLHNADDARFDELFALYLDEFADPRYDEVRRSRAVDAFSADLHSLRRLRKIDESDRIIFRAKAVAAARRYYR